MRVGIIGLGAVGDACAHLLVSTGLARTIVLANRSVDVAHAVRKDLEQSRACKVHRSAQMVHGLMRVEGIGNVNAIAQEAAMGALEDIEFTRDVVRRTNIERNLMTEQFIALGLRPLPSGTNFVLVDFAAFGPDEATTVQKHLLETGIKVRLNHGYDLATYLRFTVGLPKDTERVFAGLQRYYDRK